MISPWKLLHQRVSCKILDQFQINGSSSNPIFGVQTQWTSTDFDIYECKPFMDNGGHGHVVDNSQSGGYLNLSLREKDLLIL